MRLSVADIAMLEDVSTRQVQRYIAEGLKGHKLPAVRVGRALLIEKQDYFDWRRMCGLDAPDVRRQATQIPAPEPASPSEERPPAPFTGPGPVNPPESPAHCRPAVVDGPLTNVPDSRSGNWPSPETMREHLEQNAKDLIDSYGVKSYDPGNGI